MFEVNDFNAIRISLASPDQIHSWSYGEVTKPETINYRTLKPEKDGLFCERIFGPTKDFECYCGKYKRVRYKGIVCDKCGVEVARAKVRRERMGHIELAAPVAHIWFVKGTPSRLGLLLDLSPRSLERVLYFAQYIVTYVDEEAKQEAIAELRQEIEEEKARRQQPILEEIRALEESSAAEVARLEEQVQTQLSQLQEEQAQRIAELEQNSDLSDEQRAEQRAELEREYAQRSEDIRLMADAAIQERNYAVATQLEPLRMRLRDAAQAVDEEYREWLDDLNALKNPITHDQMIMLREERYRELADRFGHVFRAGMGAEALLELLQQLDLNALREKLQQDVHSPSSQRRKKANKRLRVVEAFRKSGNKPEWMILTVLPVLPPELRPMVQLDGGRFATSDLNDLYRRVINRNNRLKRLLELGAPEIIIRNEKRMLQEAVDSLIDNGRRGRAVAGTSNHRLKSLSDMLRGKQGRFRQNLLGKRVDYSGRSVIIVGPQLKLHQCGLPKRMALELFKPFVMHALVAKGLAHNIKSAKRMVERARPEVWDILDEVIKERPVLLNRAPTLHRLGIQAFEPVLIEGSAIQIHPLVCAAFNADFDGDQMAVHVPLSRYAVAEARQVLLASHNLLLPSNGEPTVAPTLDMVLGCYYMTMFRPDAKGAFKPDGLPQGLYSSFEEAKLAYDLGLVDLQAPIRVRDRRTDGKLVETSIGRIILNEVVPDELGFRNEVMDKKALKQLVAECYQRLGKESTVQMLDRLKEVGFHYATLSGITIAVNDLKVPEEKAQLLADADARIAEIEEQYQMGLITEDERYSQAVAVWTEVTDRMQDIVAEEVERYGSVHMMATSGAKGNIAQIRQMAAMRGLMSDPSGRIIDLPIRSSFREGLTVLEYFISTHGARKGLADTALRTADSGYLTRRLVDVAQDVIVLEEDCGTHMGITITRPSDPGALESMAERIIGRYAAEPIVDPNTGEIIVDRNEEIDERAAARIDSLNIEQVYVRSPLSCEARRGVCRLCYGRDLALGSLVELQTAVGVVAAQSIGEPGTQLTMRTFHTGGVAGIDITSGLPRVEELFEARVPKGQAIIAEIDGVVEIMRDGDGRRIRLVNTEVYQDEYPLPAGAEVLVQPNDWVQHGTVLARVNGQGTAEPGTTLPALAEDGAIVARIDGRVVIEGDNRISLVYEEQETKEYAIPAAARIRVDNGQYVTAGHQLTDGSVNPQDMLRIRGREAVQNYLVEEVQKVYRSQGVNINDKHIEVIVRQMLRKVRVDDPGDTEFLPGELVDRFQYEEVNARVLAEGGEPATAQTVLLGITRASLTTDSFLAAASFQDTSRVLTEAAITGAVDRLLGLKENVIIGKLIPARANIDVPKPVRLPSPFTSPLGGPAFLAPGTTDGQGTAIGLRDELDLLEEGIVAEGEEEEGFTEELGQGEEEWDTEEE